MKFNVLLGFLITILFAVAANAAPTITYFTPTYGAPTDTGYISIYGSGFTGGTLVVKYGGVNGVQDATANATQSNLIQSRVPAGASSGPIYVSVGGFGVLSATNFTVIGSGPYIASFSPSGGDSGTSVTITGAHFTSGSGGAAVVKFNGKAGTVNLSSDTSLTVTVPSGATTGPIAVERSGLGTNTSSAYFYVNPVIKSFTPSSGRAGTNVVIRGTNFTDATSVSFNGISVSSINFSSLTATQITVAVPSGVTTGPLYVYTPAPNPGFTTSNFVMLPLITSFTPTTGRPGTNVTIYGENLLGATNVLFNGIKAGTPSGVTYSQLTTTVPAGATNGYITVLTTNGSYTIDQLFYLPPRITSFTPTNGSTGASVKITGTNFLGATAVTFNGTPATSFVVTNNGIIGAIVPASVVTGPIYVTTPYGTTNSTGLFYAQPIVSGFTPTHGLPGTNVTILGTNFTGVTVVKFNGTNAAFGVTNGVLTAIVPTNGSTGPITIGGPAGTNVSASSFVLDYSSDLGVSISAPTNVLLTNNFTYVITVTNKGPTSAPNVFLTNSLPGSVQFQLGSINPSAGRSFLATGTPVIASLGTIASSNAVTVTLTVKPLATGLITDTALVVGGYDDPVSTNNTSSASTTIYVVPVLTIQTLSTTQVQLSWSVLLSDYILQSSTNLIDTNAWSEVLTAPDYVGDQKVVTETIGSGAHFYRLKQ